MEEKKVNPLVQHVLNNTEKALALIEKHSANHENAVFWAVATTGPNYILTLLLGGIFSLMSEKKFIIAITRTDLHMIGIKKMAIEEVSYKSIPIGTIQKSDVKKYPLGSNLRLVLSDGKVLTLKDLTNDAASKLKDAIDSAQGSKLVTEPV